MNIAGQDGFEDCNRADSPGQTSYCHVDRATQIIIDVIVAFAAVYFAVTCTLLLSRLRSYRKLFYTFVQVGLVYNALQVDLIAAATPAVCHQFTCFVTVFAVLITAAVCEGNACRLFWQLWTRVVQHAPGLVFELMRQQSKGMHAHIA